MEENLIEINAAVLKWLDEGESAERLIAVRSIDGFSFYTLGSLRRLPSGKILHEFCFPPIECDFCDLLNRMEANASSLAKKQGLKVAHVMFRFQHNRPPQIDLLRDAALIELLRREMAAEIRAHEALNVTGLQLEVTFAMDDEDLEAEIAVLAKRSNRWKVWNSFLDEAVFQSLWETNGADMQRMHVHLDDNDFWIASDPPKPALGFLPLSDVVRATISTPAASSTGRHPVPFDATEFLKINDVFQRRLGKGESVKISCRTYARGSGVLLSDPEFSNFSRHEYCDRNTEDCEVCAACQLLKHIFMDWLEHAGLKHGVGEIKFRKHAAPKLVVFEKSRLKERLKQYLKKELHWQELLRKAEAIRIEISFGSMEVSADFSTRYLEKIDGKWNERMNAHLEMAYFHSLRESYGNDITQMVVHVEGNDFWIATDPAKPRIGFLPLSQAPVATEG
ncbi:MAG: hypothetical protein U0176_01240 [Bacteroidia bacterium]